jgi:nitrogenase subunit NifH
VLLSEVRHVEAAVVNLESYGGHEGVLCEGYGLLDRIRGLKALARDAKVVDGVLCLTVKHNPAPCPGAP